VAKFTARAARFASRSRRLPQTPNISGRAGCVRHLDALMDGETLTFGFARGGSFQYLAIEGAIQGSMFGSLAVNARAGLGSPYPRPMQAGMSCRHHPPAGGRAPHRLPPLPTRRSGL